MLQPFGLLNVNKPEGWTSRQAVDRVARIVKPAKAGHAGTLDPMATGVLMICVGKATRLINFIQEQPKTYCAEFVLGQRSDTDDITGQVTATKVESEPSLQDVTSRLSEFLGRIEQVPPQYSAVHIDGQRAYKLARKGRQFEIAARTVEVHRIELVRYEYPLLETVIECGSGTYIRSIGRDLGERLGCGAVMSRLERTAIGPFVIEEAIDPQEITAESLPSQLLPATTAVSHLPRYSCTADDVTRLRDGRSISVAGAPPPCETAEPIAVIGPDGELAALANSLPEGKCLQPYQVFC